MFGGADNDEIYGEDGNDILSGDSGFDYLNGGEGDDILAGGANDDGLEGAEGRDTLLGGSGDDVLTGGLDADILDGGAGFDIFSYVAVEDSGLTNGDRDLIKGFVQGEDFIDLSSLSEFTLVYGTGAGGSDGVFTGTGSSEITFAFAGGKTIVSGDVDGDAGADFSIGIQGAVNLTAADFFGVV